MQHVEASRIYLYALVYTAHHNAANRLGLPHALRAPIHQLSVHQSEPKPSRWRDCFYRVFIFEQAAENTQLFFGKARQTMVCRARFSTLRLASMCHMLRCSQLQFFSTRLCWAKRIRCIKVYHTEVNTCVDFKLRCVIKYYSCRGKMTAQIFKKLKTAYSDEGWLSWATVFWWSKLFTKGPKSTQLWPRGGSKLTVTTETLLNMVSAIIREDRRLFITSLSQSPGIYNATSQ